MAVQMPKDAQELFDVMIPAGLKQFPDKAREVNGSARRFSAPAGSPSLSSWVMGIALNALVTVAAGRIWASNSLVVVSPDSSASIGPSRSG